MIVSVRASSYTKSLEPLVIPTANILSVLVIVIAFKARGVFPHTEVLIIVPSSIFIVYNPNNSVVTVVTPR